MLRTKAYLAIISGHFVVDLLNGSCAVLLAVLATPLALSNADISLILMLYMVTASVAQPLFGWMVDHFSETTMPYWMTPPLLAGIAVTWMGLLYGIVSFSQGITVLLVCLLLASLGSGLFHPIGTVAAASANPQRANSATAYFFLAGQMGIAIGPIMGGLLFRNAGRAGLLPMALLALLPAVLLFGIARHDHTVSHPPGHPEPDQPSSAPEPHNYHQTTTHPLRAWLRQLASCMVVAFILLIVVRSSMQSVYAFLLPKLFADRGWDPVLYGLLAGVFMGTAAFGNVLVGNLADRFGVRLVSVTALLLSVPTSLVFLVAEWLPVIFLGCGLSGVLIGGLHSVLVVHAQLLLPVRKRFAAGLILGFTFASGSVGAWLSGVAADHYSLLHVMEAMALMGIPAALLALTLPGRRIAAMPTAGARPA